PVNIEKPETVTSPGGLQRSRLADELNALTSEPFGRAVRVGHRRNAERDQVHSLVGGFAQSDDVLLGAAFGGKEGQVAVGVLKLEAPGAGEEFLLLDEIRDSEVDVTQ